MTFLALRGTVRARRGRGRGAGLVAEERGERDGTEAAAGRLQEVAARDGEVVAMAGHEFWKTSGGT